MMYGGATPLFGAGALGDEEGGKEDKPSRPDRMFEDDSDDDGEAFLQQLTKPPEEQKVQMTIGAGGQPKKKVKSNNPFGSSSDEDDDYATSKATAGAYQGNVKRKVTAFLAEDNDSEEEKFVP